MKLQQYGSQSEVTRDTCPHLYVRRVVVDVVTRVVNVESSVL